MKRLKNQTLVGSILLMFMLAAAQAEFVPWDVLTGDNWIAGATSQAQIHTVNGSTYGLLFDTLKDGAARGMNAIKFSDGTNNTGHLTSVNWTGSFDIDNTGGKVWNHVLLLVAIDSDTLGQDFSFSLSTDGGFSYNFDPVADFCLYNNPQYDTGRPSGFYSATTPDHEGIAYNFDTGMVTVFELPDITIANGASVTIDYSFENLPGRAVFSAYADQGTAFQITHTNRSSVDLGDTSLSVSTFEVVPEPTTILLMTFGAFMLKGKRNFVWK